jgi:spermidine synthase
MLQDPRVRAVTTVELCGGEYDLAKHLGEEGRVDLQRMFADPRYEARVGDGRKYLLGHDQRYDLITVDTLRPTAAFSGSLYSQEFYELVRDRLDDGGIVAQWIPTGRVPNTVATVFPYVVAMSVPTYNKGAMFFVASRRPIELDPALLEQRFAAVPVESFGPTQRASLATFLRAATRRCIANGAVARGLPSRDVNLDLRPRDEYFINNDSTSPEVVSCR